MSDEIIIKGNESEDNPVIGYYKNGDAIHKNPSEEEIVAHLEEWVQTCKDELNIDFMETMNDIRDAAVCNRFSKRMREMKLSDDKVIEYAIETWATQWPWKVGPFKEYMRSLKSGLHNEKGYGVNDNSQLLVGSIPPDLKALLIAYRPNFFEKNGKGKIKNLDALFSRFKLGKITNYKSV